MLLYTNSSLPSLSLSFFPQLFHHTHVRLLWCFYWSHISRAGLHCHHVSCNSDWHPVSQSEKSQDQDTKKTCKAKGNCPNDVQLIWCDCSLWWLVGVCCVYSKWSTCHSDVCGWNARAVPSSLCRLHFPPRIVHLPSLCRFFKGGKRTVAPNLLLPKEEESDTTQLDNRYTYEEPE